jgi:hypothetical protein
MTLEVIHMLIYTRFDFIDGIDLTICESNKAVNKLGPVVSKIS